MKEEVPKKKKNIPFTVAKENAATQQDFLLFTFEYIGKRSLLGEKGKAKGSLGFIF